MIIAEIISFIGIILLFTICLFGVFVSQVILNDYFFFWLMSEKLKMFKEDVRFSLLNKDVIETKEAYIKHKRFIRKAWELLNNEQY